MTAYMESSTGGETIDEDAKYSRRSALADRGNRDPRELATGFWRSVLFKVSCYCKFSIAALAASATDLRLSFSKGIRRGNASCA